MVSVETEKRIEKFEKINRSKTAKIVGDPKITTENQLLKKLKEEVGNGGKKKSKKSTKPTLKKVLGESIKIKSVKKSPRATVVLNIQKTQTSEPKKFIKESIKEDKVSFFFK